MDDFILTLDIDWAQDWVIDHVAQHLIDRKVQATWFVTHASPAIDRLRKHPGLFELGAHPNMLPGSTHGKTADEVLAHIKRVVPEAVSMRTHGLYQSSNFLIRAHKEYGIKIDVSLFLPRMQMLIPHQLRWYGARLWRVPYFWEDDSEIFEEDPIWDLTDERLHTPGLKILNFHPIHVALNTNDYQHYESLKGRLPLQEWRHEFVAENACKGLGSRDIFLKLADALAHQGRRISDLVANG